MPEYPLEVKVIPDYKNNGSYTVATKVSNVAQVFSNSILSEVVSRISDKFVEDHYKEIEKELDIKVVAAVLLSQMGVKLEEKMQLELEKISEVAQQALRRVKKAGL